MTMCKPQTSIKENTVIVLVISILTGIGMLYADYSIMQPMGAWSNSLLTRVGWPTIILSIISLSIIAAWSFRR